MKALLACLAVTMALAPRAHAQSAEKAEIRVFNNSHEPITMRFSYAFRDHTWKLAEQAMPIDTDIVYRFPSNIPGCEKLHEWGIADGVLSLWSKGTLICDKRVSLCDKGVTTMDVRETECRWAQGPTAPR
jgi:hypothetical protein